MKKGKVAADVPEYIEGFPPPVRKELKKLRAAIKKSAPGVEEKISYGMPAYKLNGVLCYFAGYAKHIGFYAMPSAVKAFATDLAKFETSKGTIRFPLGKPLPLPLINKIVKFRVKENAAAEKWR